MADRYTFSDKSPTDSWPHKFDFTEIFAKDHPDDLIVSADVGIELPEGSTADADDLTRNGSIIDADTAWTVTTILTKGVPGRVYNVVCTATTANSHIIERRIMIKVRNR